jgi:adenosine kinase
MRDVVGHHISFGMGVLGARPLLVGAVGRDAADYLAWLSDHGVDVSAVRTSDTLATARFTCTTDQDHAQLATFYPGRHGRGRADRRRGARRARPRRRRAGRPRRDAAPLGVVPRPGRAVRRRPVAAAGLHGRRGDPRPGRGATYLFTNDYEAGLVHEKTGWGAADVLERVGTRVTTHGAGGVVVERRGEDALHVGVAPAREIAEPTGVGDAFRAGFLTATAWGVGLERACQVGALLATLVLETVGTQEYAFERAPSPTGWARPTAARPPPRSGRTCRADRQVNSRCRRQVPPRRGGTW